MAFSWFKKSKQLNSPNIDDTPVSDSFDNSDEPGALHEEKNQEPEVPDTSPATKDTTDNSSNGMFNRLRNRLTRTRKGLTSGLETIFSGRKQLDEELLEELEELLITSDIGVKTSMDLIQHISGKASKISDPQKLKTILKDEITQLLSLPSHQAIPSPALEPDAPRPFVMLVLGVNGVGKTTTIGKLAARYHDAGKRVLIAAADTFRAAAGDQLQIWSGRANAEIVRHKDNADPAAVTYDAVSAAKARGVDIVLIDTAGRIHTKTNLMEELKKIKRTVTKIIPDAPHETLLVLDATTGQNALSQTRMFHEAVGVTGIALTKLDGTAKGGIVIGICAEMNIPLRYIGIGEQVEDLQEFHPADFTDALF